MTPEQRLAAMDLMDQGREEHDAYEAIWSRRQAWPAAPLRPVQRAPRTLVPVRALAPQEARRASPPHETPSKPETAKSPRHTTFTAAELQRMKFPDVRFVVPGYVAEGLTLLAGKPKLGKSWLALQFCIGVATGAVALGERRCPEGDVLYAALEDNPRRLQTRMDAVLPMMSDWPGRLTFWTEMPVLAEGGLDALRAWIEGQSEPRLIVIDVLNKVRSARGNGEDSYAYDYRSVTPLKELADQYGIAIVVIHHTRKMAADDQLEAVSGTNGLTGAADTILVLDRKSEGVTLYGRGRDIEEVETAVEFRKDGCRWHMLGDAVDVRRSDERTSILEALREEGAPMSSRLLATATGLKDGNVRFLLHKMSKAGEVAKAARGLYLHPDLNPANNANSANNGEDEA